jgi:uncharacterized RDD family membrane protein YckC
VRWTLLDLAAPHERAAAWLIDAGIFWGLLVGGLIYLTETGELGTSPRLVAPRALVWLLVVWAVSRAYDAACVHLWGSSVGRRVAGIEVRSASGTLPDRSHAVLRSVVQTPAVMLAGVGLLSIRTDRQRRAFHDQMAGTVVVRTDGVERVSGDIDGGLVTPEPATHIDANERAIRRANVAAQQASWLRTIAEQTEVRLDIANPSWRRADDPGAIHFRAFCLLLARLLERYPAQRAVIVGVLDNHDELVEIEGSRERFLTRLLDEPERARRWIGLSDSANLRIVLDEPAWSSSDSHR